MFEHLYLQIYSQVRQNQYTANANIKWFLTLLSHVLFHYNTVQGILFR